MEKKTKCGKASKEKKGKNAEIQPEDLYSGVSINTGDNNSMDSALIKERTRTLNNNPRNSEYEGN